MLKVIEIPYTSPLASKITEAFPFHNASCIDGKLLGALWVISQIRRAVPVIHGPVGCSWQRKFSIMGSQIHYWTPCTWLTESHVVFGGEGRLFDCVLRVFEVFRPDMIIILTTCTSDMIGDDVETITQKLKQKLKTPIIYSTGNKAGKVRQVGSQDVLYSIVEQYVLPNTEDVVPEEGLINIMTIGGEYSKTFENELPQVLKAAGARVNKIYFTDRSVPELLELAKAKVNVVPYFQLWTTLLKSRGVEDHVVIKFEEMDLEKAYPLGYDAAKREVVTICEKAGITPDEKSIERFYEPMLSELEKIRKECSNITVALENDWGPGLILARELGVKIRALIFWTYQYRGHGYSEESAKMMIDGLAQYARMLGHDPEVIVDEPIDKVSEKLKRLNVDLVITGWWSNIHVYHREGLRTLSSREIRLFFEFGISPIIEAGRRIIARVRRKVSYRPILEASPGKMLPYLTDRWEKHTLLFHMNRFSKV